MIRRRLLHIVALLLTSANLYSQTISQFTWESGSPLTAVVGPNANSVSGVATISSGGSASPNGLNAGTPATDINLTFSSPASLALFDALNGIDIAIDFKRKEANASFVSRGASLDFGINGGNLYVNFLYSNGLGGSVPVASGSIAAIPSDNLFHTYRFTYDNVSGLATVRVDGVIKYSLTGVAGRAMYWTGAGNLVVGRLMDGSGNNVTILDNLIIAVPGTTLPIDLLSFDGKLVNNNEVELSWTTLRESTATGFLVEKAITGDSFVTVATVPAIKGTSAFNKYTFPDKYLTNTEVDYRLGMKDQDGSISYSPVVHIAGQYADLSVKVFPNPVVTSLNIAFSSTRPDTYQIVVVDGNGRLLKAQKVQIQQGASSVKLDMTKGRHGQYFFITVTNSMNQVQAFKVLKW